ncbi:MAG: serine hydrolase [Hymenobacteraceae bacterium]|nr:serine hydrolase [Hymenobacteraceae bacterium]
MLLALTRDSPLLDSLLHARPTLDSLILKADDLNIQIIYTQINRDAQNRPRFTRHTWHLDSTRYFNPASLVKLPVCIAALEKLHRYEAQGVTFSTPMATGVAYRCQTPVRNPRSANSDRVASVGNYVRRMLLVSDNDAYNRLYEFVGQQTLHERLASWQMPTARITNRFSPGCDIIANRHTNPIIFLPRGRPPVVQSAAFNLGPLPPPFGPVKVGRAYRTAGNQLIPEPFDFTNANYLALDHVTTLLQSVLFPGTGVELNLTPSDRQLLIRHLALAPHESGNSLYRDKAYFDTYKKYLYYGRRPQTQYPAADLRSFNIVGLSYGFVADCAYFVEPSTGTEFLLSAVLYANPDGVLNDGRYAYHSVGWPFLRDLGQAVYQLEQKRRKANEPDLSEFRL